MNEIQKANVVNEKMQVLEGQYRRENRIATADRMREVRVLLMASPDTAARLYDILRDEGAGA